MDEKSKVYIKADAQWRIIACEGGYTTPADLSGWVFIDEGTGDRFNLCQSHYFDGGLFTEDGIPRYKFIDLEVLPRTDAEIAADRAALPAPPETEAEQIATLQARLDEADSATIELYELILGGE